mgnify:CR=1 FL=1
MTETSDKIPESQEEVKENEQQVEAILNSDEQKPEDVDPFKRLSKKKVAVPRSMPISSVTKRRKLSNIKS